MKWNAPSCVRRLALLSTGLAIACTAPSPPTATAPNRPDPAPEAAVPASPPSESPAMAIMPPEPSPNPASMAQPEVQLVPVMAGLERPWGMAWLPDGSMLITERAGRLRQVQNGQLLPTPIAGVPPVFAQGQGGLLDIALHPRFAENQWVYFTYAAGNAQANRTRVARARFDGDALQDWQDIFEVSQAKAGGQHFGARLLWLPDETLLVSIGDGGNPPVRLAGQLIRLQAQNLDSALGKVLRLNADGSIPDDNPVFDRQPSQRLPVWSYGHRNIQGLAYDPLRDRVWATEHGARGGDELNLVQPGENYGWPVVSHSREYATGQPVAPAQSQPGAVDPLMVWTPAIAPSGLAVYSGEVFPAWRGHLFAGGLVSRSVLRLEATEQGATVSEIIAVGQRVRDVRQGPDGLIYILTDEVNGRLLRLEPR
ncbi:MAG: PQQ-dependent sugar dehydrogenase [Spirulinaceae cyanobacterium SM2_1_0]|nr:PQQ-dependent sugar dehydrogenase [Spirulinaceae cyanobacterium SM2_1_0]